MHIDRIKARKVFDDYVNLYDSSDEKIKLKIEHTYRVSELSERIAKEIGLSKDDIDIAWIIGLLHDIGRFEQVKTYGTFNDAESIDHAKLGVKILFDENKIREFIDDEENDEIIRCAIDYHNMYRIPENLSERMKLFCNIIRDADKVDIFKVNMIVPLEEIYNVSYEEIHNAPITKEVLENFMQKDTILRKLKKTAADNIVGQIALVFGLVYKQSIAIVQEQGYLEQLMNFKSDNKDTAAEIKTIHDFVHLYISEKIKA